ncbi:MAG: hypothetical protein HY517_03220 [Candidatus Aenigmarchaeota archaeon]|nr:hypothetical protein [Candidatus Aenigmarchaeota archaeon]
MKICSVCLSSDILCSGCSRKLESGQISRADVGLSRALHKIGGIDFVQAFEENGRLFVVVDSIHAKKFIGPGGKNIRKVSELLGMQVKLMEKASGSEKHIIEKLIGAPVLGINKVYSGGEFFKVRVERRFARNVLPLKDVIGKILNKKVSFVFE